MIYHKEAELINALVSISEIKNLPATIPNISRHFGFDNQVLLYEGLTKVKMFEDVVANLYLKNKEVFQTYSLMFFEHKIARLIKDCVAKNTEAQPDDLENLFSEVLKIEHKEYEVIAELFGCKLDKEKIDLGGFTIYNYELSKEQLYLKYPKLEEVEKKDIRFREADLFVSVKVNARDSLKAIENAEKHFLSFESVINYMTAINQKRAYNKMGIFDFNVNKSRRCYALTFDNVGSKGESIERSVKNLLRQDDLLNEKIGNDKIWNLLFKENRNKVEERIINAVEWIGKAAAETDFSNSLIHFAFSIEKMLQMDTHKWINPSIISQLSEWTAFILEKDFQKRLEISDYIKDLYSKRSAIAHGEFKIISKEDLKAALEISSRLVITFLTVEPYKLFSKMEELSKHIERLRFN